MKIKSILTAMLDESIGMAAEVALGHKMLRTIYAMLSKNTHYVDKTEKHWSLWTICISLHLPYSPVLDICREKSPPKPAKLPAI